MSEELWSGEDGRPWDVLGKHVPEVANEFLLGGWQHFVRLLCWLVAMTPSAAVMTERSALAVAALHVTQ